MLTEINWDKNLKLLCIPPVRSAVHSVGVVFIMVIDVFLENPIPRMTIRGIFLECILHA